MAPITSFSQNPAAWGRPLLLLTVLCAVFLMPVASAYGYSEDYEGYLGETIALHGVSYSGDTIYLFMTGPGLPANGAPLTDPTKRADQGYNTMVGLASDQTWSYKWDTSKLEREIDPGTYLVYAVNAQADASSLAGHSYQTLSVYLKDGALSKDRVSTGAKYTLNLLDDDPTVLTTATTVPPTPPVIIAPETTAVTTSVPPAPAATKSSLVPLLVITAIAAGCLYAHYRQNR
ncbi:hypothetical protein [Methanoregula formicica]|uniref:DUF3821 domain-containing protein n=1 Tax=Methanoregula formicica (strain DSM 22288 / NBRC 105244 / SMSP) TaxID=593750 RepID=L0HHV9_METFS|nr:hypothetical protein [Methanoregula formicica]AGB03615.1 hypothetical protein Metfor_2623 [Methanoregula formicica SMSP]